MIIKDVIKFSLNIKLYPKDIIFSAAYTLMDKAYFIFEGNPEVEISVILSSKTNQDLSKLKFEFFQELNNQVNYHAKFERNKDMVKAIVARALFSVNPEQSPPLKTSSSGIPIISKKN